MKQEPTAEFQALLSLPAQELVMRDYDNFSPDPKQNFEEGRKAIDLLQNQLRAVCVNFHQQYGALPVSGDLIDHADGHTYQVFRFIDARQQLGDVKLQITFNRLDQAALTEALTQRLAATPR